MPTRVAFDECVLTRHWFYEHQILTCIYRNIAYRYDKTIDTCFVSSYTNTYAFCSFDADRSTNWPHTYICLQTTYIHSNELHTIVYAWTLLLLSLSLVFCQFSYLNLECDTNKCGAWLISIHLKAHRSLVHIVQFVFKNTKYVANIWKSIHPNLLTYRCTLN